MSNTVGPKVYPAEVRYREGEPDRIEIDAERPDGEHFYHQSHTFRVEDATARLTGIETDGTYNVPASEDTREAVAEAVQDLPFIERVVLFDGVRRVGPALEYPNE